MTLKELHEMQEWTLDQKIYHSLEVISTFVERVGGVNRAYVSFSGGKDSTVLLDLVQRIYPDIAVVFINTGNEWPEIIKFVHQKEKEGTVIITIKSKKTPREVWKEVGFPLISKETAAKIAQIRRNPTCESSKKILKRQDRFRLTERWKYLIGESYDVSSRCCDILKKAPAHQFESCMRKHPILGVMACESKMRESAYIRMGSCNTFGENKRERTASWPLAIWTEQDIQDYIKKYNIKIAEIYDKGVTRTGCVGCGFGCFLPLEDNPSLRWLYKLYPKYYRMIMNYTNHGVTYREALRKIKAMVNEKLPDE